MHPVYGDDEGSLKSCSNEPKVVKKTQKFLKRGSEISQTFPKISPSRKIQNINIVFPATNSAVSKFSEKSSTLDSADEEKMMKKSTTDSKTKKENENQIIGEEDSLDEFLPEKMSTFKDDTILNKNLETSIGKKTARILTYDDSPKRYGMNNYFYSNNDNIEIEKGKDSVNVDDNYRKEIFDSKFNFFESRKFNDNEENTSTNVLSKNISPKLLKNGSLMKNSCQNFNEEKFDVTNEEEEEKYDSIELFKTPKKSTEMENIIKKSNNRRKRLSGKSFVEEIIEELNAKCSPKVKTSNVTSPNSKNFVKKLVRELEMGCFAENENNKNRSGIFNDKNLSKNTEDNCSINAESKYFSKDNENEFGDMTQKTFSLRSSICSSPFRSFSQALEGRSGCEFRESVTPYVDDDDESVFWIPLPICRLPRTSSLKNVTSTNLPVEISEPSKSDSSVTTGWGRTFDKGQRRSRALFRIDETTVGDSGYSDRSDTNSSSSSIIGEESWYSESETTITASEDSDNGFDNYSNNFGKAHSYRSKQRTSVV